MGGNAWRGGVVAAVASWSFAGFDVAAHHGALDPIAAALVALGGIFVAIPRIDSLRASFPLIGGNPPVEVAINQLRAAVDAATASSDLAVRAGDTAEEAAKLYEHWLRELQTLFATLEAGDADRETYARAIFRFINTRLEDVSTWVGDADEEVRASLWWWSREDGGACVVAAPRISDRETLEYVFRPGIGILGRVLQDGEIANVADAPAEAGWQHIAAHPPHYHGLLCVPIVSRGRVAGVLAVDRVKDEAFGDDSVRFVRQVVLLVRLAAFHATVPKDLFSLPSRATIPEVAPAAPDSR